jgi:hypothetical protein
MASSTSNEIAIDSKFLTRTLGTYIMFLAVAVGVLHWVNVLFFHVPNLGWMQPAVIWIGLTGSVLFALYFLMKLFGYSK